MHDHVTLKFVDGLRDVALQVERGQVAVYAWEWGTEDGSREEWQRRLDDAALNLNVVIRFMPLPAKRMTIGFNADDPPPKEGVDMAIRAVEKYRDVDTVIPSAQDVALVHQHFPKRVL
jgi:hypothetical protein